MYILAKAAGGEVDEYYDVLEAFCAQGADGSGFVITFQRQLSAQEPWNGDPSTDDYFNNSYCITLGSEATIYGGLEQVSFLDSRRCCYFSEPAATGLGIGRKLIVDFEVAEQLLHLFQRFLRQAVTWGVPSQTPQLNGLAFKDSIWIPPTLSQGRQMKELRPPISEAVTSNSYLPPKKNWIGKADALLMIGYTDSFHDLGWIDSDICNFLIQFENGREYIRAELRMKGQRETDIQKLEDLCQADMEDFSHLRRSGANRALEQYRSELYLLHENKRQRRVMLDEE
ncbi:uncharacterized protein N7496_007651 [Penicillium cataractarum]|uniref:Uncharacterized protein n=1 Tax=Penicillium cataractarum TaxID=2100454 RepID=A0A9W9RWY7_9EURO|nr:uncharacterized protein N7496_007651 [Penicillium cataractarum]KAJ5367891.1 hypothetical protein N7496_007651 [Penicillium cataractarum]